MRVSVLAGGVGGGRFLKALVEYQEIVPTALDEITAIVNISDDFWFNGLRVCPDLDTITYTLARVNDQQRGWGRIGDSERVHEELLAYGLGRSWFTLGDLDIATSIARTHFLREGRSLTEAEEVLTERWDLPVRLLPVCDDPVETHVQVEGREGDLLHFQEWWVRYGASLPVQEFKQVGVHSATVTSQVRDALTASDLILVAPSNPVVSISTILAIPGVREAIATSEAPVVGVSPIINGQVIRGRADACLNAVGVDTSAAAVADWYGARANGGLLDGWLVDPVDFPESKFLSGTGIYIDAVPLWLDNSTGRADIVHASLKMCERLSTGPVDAKP